MTQPSAPPENLERLSRLQILVAMAVTAIILLIVAKIWMRFDQVALLPLDWSLRAVLIGIALGVGISLASAGLYQLWPQYRKAANLYLALVLQPLLWADLLWLGLLPGLSEELLFRGVMLSAFGLTTTALILSSLCFGILHLGGTQQWPYVIWASLVGGILGYSALATGNLLIPVVAHISTNWIAGITWKLLHPNPPTVKEAGKG